jgi:MFS family permease
MFVWKGMSQGEAGLMFSLMFFLSIPMRLAAGYLGDHIPLQPMMGGGMVAAGLAVVAMLVMDGNTAVYLFVVLMAVEQGGSTLNWVALGNFFGRTSFATLMGIISTAFNLGMLVSPIYAGYMFDRTDSYTVVLISFLPIYLASGVFFLMTRKPEAPVSTRTPVYGR